MQLSRGQKLSTKLVKGLGLGILFSPNICALTEMSGEQLDVIVGGIQQDPGRIHILGRQLEDLIAEKGPDLHVLCNKLREEKLVSKEECRELHAILAMDADALPRGPLNSVVEPLIKDVRTKVLGKRKIREGDSVAINNVVDAIAT
ncbi:hypothetical protein LTR41_002435 [Exophiala xenobiotica]|nr:hypothetical protein LTR41_002435 [Exophiala xenobiotica]